ncbi:helix-turn-helix domain-containing protein [Streptomyces roseoverticillatus]|uniref:helix-turn-helix domain-containing protein n=1 Tax=Streptomyces roseoverticillatus TaxID=66429 RepID=UPI0033FE21A3
MRIHLSARRRAFTVLGNEVLRDRRLSFTARGILAFLLSLPDGAREDVRTLADKNPGLGRRGVAKAVEELIALGYYVRRTVRDEESGQVRTETYVFDTPLAPDSPLPVSAGTGKAKAGKTGAFPQGKKNPEEVPPTQPDVRPPARQAGEPTPIGGELGRAAALLSRIGAAEPKLALGSADVLTLAPLAAPWLERGLSELEVRSLLTDELPRRVYSPRALLADRLVRKLPAPRTRRDAAAPAAPPAECAECRDPLPRGHEARVCAACAETSSGPVNQATGTTAPLVAERVAALRAVVRARPAHVPVART